MAVIKYKDGSMGWEYPKKVDRDQSHEMSGMVVNVDGVDYVIIGKNDRFKGSFVVARIMPDGSGGFISRVTVSDAAIAAAVPFEGRF
jgi:hypothetical protein